MDTLSTCRICLIKNVKMQILNNNNLRRIYERLTEIPFVTTDGKPLQVCYICYRKLRNCYQLQTSCLQSEMFLAQMLIKKVDVPMPETGRLKIIHPLISLSFIPMVKNVDKFASNEEPVILLKNLSIKDEKFEVKESSNVKSDSHVTVQEVLNFFSMDELNKNKINSDDLKSIDSKNSESQSDECKNDEFKVDSDSYMQDFDDCDYIMTETEGLSRKDNELHTKTNYTPREELREEAEPESIEYEHSLTVTQTHHSDFTNPRVGENSNQTIEKGKQNISSGQSRKPLVTIPCNCSRQPVKRRLSPTDLSDQVKSKVFHPVASTSNVVKSKRNRHRREHRLCESDSESGSPPDSTLRELQSHRRHSLRKLYSNLKNLVPATKNAGQISNDMLLREAAAYCRELNERHILQQKHEQLLMKLNQLK